MSRSPTLDTLLFVTLSGIFHAAIVLPSDHLRAEELTTGPTCSCPSSDKKPANSKLADLTPLDQGDEIAALVSIQAALSKMHDGTPLVWRRGNGRISGIVRPTRSFRSQSGALCRHLVVLLTTGTRTRTAEGVACRLEGGRWQLEG